MSATFRFRAVDAAGAPVNGSIEAPTDAAVVDELQGRGLTVIAVESAGPRTLGVDLGGLRRVRSRDLALMTRQLATMVSAGLTLLRALMVLEKQTDSPALNDTIARVRRDVEAGRSLSSALSQHPKTFSPLYVSMVHAGEVGGFLEAALLRVADQLDSEEALRAKVRSALVYPATVISFALIVMFALVAFIVPVFARIFAEQHAQLPALTRITVGLSDLLRGYPWAPAVAVGAAVVGFRRWKESDQGRKQWDRLRLRFPFRIGALVHKIALARWSRTFSALVGAGVPLLDAIDVTGRTAGNWILERAMGAVSESVRSGGTIGAALSRDKTFPPLVCQMVTVGEETGALEDTLARTADFYEMQVDASVKALTSILEPVMIIIVGGIVAFVVISMYLPMFQVYDKIQ